MSADIFEKCRKRSRVDEAKEKGIYPYFHALETRQEQADDICVATLQIGNQRIVAISGRSLEVGAQYVVGHYLKALGRRVLVPEIKWGECANLWCAYYEGCERYQCKGFAKQQPQYEKCHVGCQYEWESQPSKRQ